MTHLVPVLRPVLGSPFRRGDLYRRAGEIPSFHISPAALGHARDLISEAVLGTYNSASPAMAVGADGILFTPAANAPAIEYNPTTLSCLGARIWGVVTNRLLQSSDFATTWTQNNVIISANAATAPDQTNTADQFSPTINGASSQRFLRQDFSTTANDTYTLSVFAKVNTATTNGISLVVQDQSAANNFRCNFNLFALTTSPAGLNWATPTGSIIAYPNGWYRCSVTGVTSTAHTSLRNSIFLNTFGSVPDTVGSVFLWGAQLNTGPLAPYVPTTTTAASSTADVWDVLSLASGINNIRSLYVRGRTTASGIRGILSLNDNSASNRLELLSSGTDPKAVAVTSGSTVADLDGGTIAANVPFRLAVRFNADSYALSVNGATVVTDASGARAVIDRLFLGRDQAGNYMNGYIEETAGWTGALSDSALQAVTT